MLLEYMSSGGRPPENELCERLTRSRPARLPSEVYKSPSRPYEDRETSVTEPSALQAHQLLSLALYSFFSRTCKKNHELISYYARPVVFLLRPPSPQDPEKKTKYN